MSTTTTTEAWLPPARRLVQEFEGCELRAYPDPASGGEPFTIGWGATIYQDSAPVKRGDRITQAQADALLDHHLRHYAAGLKLLLIGWDGWGANQQAALVSWAYNVGLGAVGGSTLRREVNAGKSLQEVAAVQLLRWIDKGSAVEAGLRRRRRAELSLLQTTDASSLHNGKAPAKPRMIGPTRKPQEFGFKAGDFHLIVNDQNETLKAFDSSGKELFTIACLARGQGLDTDWFTKGSDTPPGLYKLGTFYDDIAIHGEHPSYRNDQMLSFGWQSYDMISLDGNEEKAGRAGIMLHGGGSACGWPGAWAPRQRLYPTLGCCRIFNIDLRDKIQPLYEKGTVFLSVFQEG